MNHPDFTWTDPTLAFRCCMFSRVAAKPEEKRDFLPPVNHLSKRGRKLDNPEDETLECRADRPGLAAAAAGAKGMQT